jgi:Bacterial Ig-like domain (group 3)
MSLTLRRSAAGIATAVLAGGALLSTGGAAHAAAAPPWEPDGDSVGGLLFFNASGTQITGGNISDSPIAAYVEGAKPIRAGDDKATLFGYLPVSGQVPGQWQGEALDAATAYPVTKASAPAALKTATVPVESGISGDESIADLAVDFPNNDVTSDGYAGIYQLRLRTSSSKGGGLTPTYDSADIKITGSTWSVVYSKTQVASTTKLTATPTSVFHGAAVKLTATVSPSNAAGSVTFRNGAKKIGTVKVKAGKATLTTKALPDGTDKIKATFTPTNSTAFTSSTSAARTVTVKAHATKVSLKASAASIKAGNKLTLTIKETPAVAGKVAIFDGAKKIGTVKVKKGKASFSTTKLKAGAHSLKAKFTPTNTKNDKASTSKTVKVKVTK